MSKIKFFICGLRNYKLKLILVFFTTLITILTFNIGSSFRGSVIDTRLSHLRDLTRNSQIAISSVDGTYSFFDSDIINDINKNENVVTSLKRCVGYVNADITNELLCLYGMEISEQRNVYDFKLVSGTIDSMEQNDVIVSEDFSSEHGIKVGSEFYIIYGDKNEKFIVKAIAVHDGFFQNSKNTIVSNLDIAQSILDIGQQVNSIEVTITSLDTIDITVQQINDNLEDTGVVATKRYDMSYYNAFISTVVLAINIFSIFLISISVFILYSIFQSYVYENIEEMATLRSIGFTVRHYRCIMSVQALFIVALSFASGIILTPVFIRILAYIILQEQIDVKIQWGKTLVKDASVFLIVFSSVWLASRNAIKLSIVDVIKGEDCKLEVSKFKKSNMVLAIFTFISSLVLVHIGLRYQNVWLHYVALIGFLSAFLLSQGALVWLYGKLLYHVFSCKKGAFGLFGKQIISSLSAYLQAITTIGFVISITLVMFSMSNMLDNAMSKVYQNADLYLTVYNSDYMKFTDKLDLDNEIESYIVQKRCDLFVEDQQIIISGIDIDLYDDEDFGTVLNYGNSDLFGKLEGGHNIIITDTLSKNLKLNKGDFLTVKNTKFEIVDIVKSFENMGMVLFVSENSFKNTFDYYDYCTILIKTSIKDNHSIKNRLFKQMKEMGGFAITTLEEMSAENNASNQMILNAILGLSIFIVLVSCISLFSIAEINILARIKEFLIYRTIGLTKKDINKMALYEGLAISIYGVLCGILCQATILPVVVNILSFYVGDIEVSMSFGSIGLMLTISSILTISVMLGVIKKHVLRSDLIQRVRSY